MSVTKEDGAPVGDRLRENEEGRIYRAVMIPATHDWRYTVINAAKRFGRWLDNLIGW